MSMLACKGLLRVQAHSVAIIQAMGALTVCSTLPCNGLVWVQAQPVAISQATEALPEYRRVWCQGELLHERSVFVGPRPRTIMGSAKPGFASHPPLVQQTQAALAPQSLMLCTVSGAASHQLCLTAQLRVVSSEALQALQGRVSQIQADCEN